MFLTAIAAALSSETDESWFTALARTPEEADAMFNAHKARRVMEAASQGGEVFNG